MKKDVGVLVDIEDGSTFTNFNLDDITDMDIYFAIVHLSIMMVQRGYDMEEMFNEIIDNIDEYEILEETTDKEMLN